MRSMRGKRGRACCCTTVLPVSGSHRMCWLFRGGVCCELLGVTFSARIRCGGSVVACVVPSTVVRLWDAQRVVRNDRTAATVSSSVSGLGS